LETFLNRPFLVLGFSLIVLESPVLFGTLLGRKLRPLQEEERQDLGFVITSSLTLLALIIAFSFSMAIGRYDQRKNLEEEEANAIGTEFIRANLLGTDDAAKVRQLLRNYLDERILFYTTRDSTQLQLISADTAKLQNEMWSIVERAGLARPMPPLGLAVSGINDVLNSQGYTEAAWRNRIPAEAWTLMMAIAVGCSLLIGYGGRGGRVRLLLVLPLLVSVAFFLIADIDSPRRGAIRVVPQNLISLSQSLKPQ
jgi:hypothetical protein